MLDSKWTGFGRKYFEDNSHVSYEGECLDNVPHGFGRYFHPINGGTLWYEGHFSHGKFDGFGKLTNAGDSDFSGTLNIVYVGEWKDGTKHGLGTYIYDQDFIFEGRWHSDRKIEGTVTYCKQRFRQVFFTEG